MSVNLRDIEIFVTLKLILLQTLTLTLILTYFYVIQKKINIQCTVLFFVHDSPDSDIKFIIFVKMFLKVFYFI